VLLHDISIEPISAEDNPDYQAKTFESRLPVYLVSYADGHEVFYQNQNMLTFSGLNKGIDFFLNYRRSHLDADFYEKHKSILDERRGAGYWLWKPYVILKTMERAPEGAIIMYVDSGFSFKNSPKALLNLSKDHTIILVQYDPAVYGRIEKVTARGALEKMNCTDEACRNGFRTMGGFGIFKNTPVSRRFVKQWLDYCSDEDIIKGRSLDGKPQFPGFTNHAD